jgi:hypothetical protein
MVRVVVGLAGVATVALLCVGSVAAETSGEGGGVVFEARRLTLTAEAGKSEVFGTFSFTNRGAKPVELIKAESACPCVDLVFDKGEIPPGAASELIVVVHLESLKDAESKTVLAQFVDGRGAVARQALKIDVRFPDLARIEPAELVWNAADPLAKREVVVSFAKDAGFRIHDWKCTVPGVVAAEEKTSPKGSQRFKVSLTGAMPGHGTRGHLIFNTTSKLPHYQQLRVPLLIR